MQSDPHVGPHKAQSQFYWDNILEYSPPLDLGQSGLDVFSVSSDSEMLVAKTTTSSASETFITSWDIKTGIKSLDRKPISSFFDFEKLLNDPHYDASGYLMSRSAVIKYPSVIDSQRHSGWKVINRYGLDGTSTDQYASAFISVYNIQTSHYHHFLFKGLTTYKLLLYGTGILVFDIQAMALMRINLDTTDQHKPGDWIKVSEGTTLQLEYSSSQQSSKSPQNSFPSAEWEYDLSQQEDQFVVSNDGSALVHCSYWRSPSDAERIRSKTRQHDCDHWKRGMTLRRWKTTEKNVLSTRRIEMGVCETAHFKALSTSGDDCSILARRKLDSSALHVIPFDSDVGVDIIPLEYGDHIAPAFFPQKNIIAYMRKNGGVIRDVQAHTDMFRLAFPFDDVFHYDDTPLPNVVTPDGKTVIMVHPWGIGTWRVDSA